MNELSINIKKLNIAQKLRLNYYRKRAQKNLSLKQLKNLPYYIQNDDIILNVMIYERNFSIEELKKNNITTNIKPKEIFEIYDKNNKIIKMEAIAIYSMEETGFNYIIYKDLYNKNYFVARFKGDSVVDLDVSLNNKEMNFAQSVLEKVVENGT